MEVKEAQFEADLADVLSGLEGRNGVMADTQVRKDGG